jgi:hypothetical protein
MPTSGYVVAYTGDINVLYAFDTTPALPAGSVPTSPTATLTAQPAGIPHPEMVVACAMGAGNIVDITLTGLAVGQYWLVVEFLPSPPGAVGERIACAPATVQVPS